MSSMLRLTALLSLLRCAAVGGLAEIQVATKETQKLIEPFRNAAWKKAQEVGYTGSEWTKFAAIAERRQVVAGTNHFVKVQVGPESYIHLRIFESLPHMKKNPEMVAVELDHSYDSAIESFPIQKEL
eukprot:Skav222610  [mRNA]  locus=scaffold1190:28432:30827:+ [translate_table: standard]